MPILSPLLLRSKSPYAYPAYASASAVLRHAVVAKRFFTNPTTSSADIPNANIKTTKSKALPKANALPPRRILDEHDLSETFIRGSGPGGQKINKTSCAVHLRHIPTGLTIKTQASRSQAQNRKTARRLLAELVEEAELGEGSRSRIKVERERRRRKSGEKKRRRKYRDLEAGEGEGKSDQDGEGEIGHDGKGS